MCSGNKIELTTKDTKVTKYEENRIRRINRQERKVGAYGHTPSEEFRTINHREHKDHKREYSRIAFQFIQAPNFALFQHSNPPILAVTLRL
jgi:hypothetical protein